MQNRETGKFSHSVRTISQRYIPRNIAEQWSSQSANTRDDDHDHTQARAWLHDHDNAKARNFPVIVPTPT